MIISVGENVDPKCKFNIGTHNGIFHCDEVVGIAILELAYMEKDIHIVRSRNSNELKNLDIVIDIGGGRFDHHMYGFSACRNTGVKYASAGLVWQEFAEKVIETLMITLNLLMDDEEIQIIKSQIDNEIILPVDMEDNGEKISKHTFSFISNFLPAWFEEKPDYDKDFYRAERIVCEILREKIKDKIIRLITKKELQKRFRLIANSESLINDGIFEIPAQTIPWLEDVVEFNKKNKYILKFVIFPYPAGGWAAQSIPPSIERKFDKLVPFPEKWAGGNEITLPKLSGIKDATFCHTGCFFARAETKESIIKMCKVAMKK